MRKQPGYTCYRKIWWRTTRFWTTSSTSSQSDVRIVIASTKASFPPRMFQRESQDAAPPKKLPPPRWSPPSDVATRTMDEEEYVPALPPLQPMSFHKADLIHFSTINNIYTLLVNNKLSWWQAILLIGDNPQQDEFRWAHSFLWNNCNKQILKWWWNTGSQTALL